MLTVFEQVNLRDLGPSDCRSHTEGAIAKGREALERGERARHDALLVVVVVEPGVAAFALAPVQVEAVVLDLDHVLVAARPRVFVAGAGASAPVALTG